MKLSLAMSILTSFLAHVAVTASATPSPAPPCAGGYVQCTGGFAPDGTTCAAACGGRCCVNTGGDDACVGFSGKVCKDDSSCMGIEGCNYARIPHVANSCDGEKACKNVGNQGLVGDFENSCKGGTACKDLARKGGVVGMIKDSCLGERACFGLADEVGHAGNLKDSCNDYARKGWRSHQLVSWYICLSVCCRGWRSSW